MIDGCGPTFRPETLAEMAKSQDMVNCTSEELVTFQTLHPVISTRSLGATAVLRGHVKFVEILLCQDMTDFVRKNLSG